MSLAAADLLNCISALRKDLRYSYVCPKNKGKVRIVGIDGPEGPVIVARALPRGRGRPPKSDVAKRPLSISNEMLVRLGAAMAPGVPVNVDQVFGGSYNTRSILEALLAHSPEFHVCYPRGPRGHKHLVWMPGERHARGVMSVVPYDPARMAEPGGKPLEATAAPALILPGLDRDRRHVRVQASLVEIGRALGYRSHVAANDRGATCGGCRLGDMEGVVSDLGAEAILAPWPAAARAARLVDVVWLGGPKTWPVAFEVEHSTMVTSGLTRMAGMLEELPESCGVAYVVVAPDWLRERVAREAARPQFARLDVRFMPYAALDYLHDLCVRWPVRGTTREFIDTFAERCAPA